MERRTIYREREGTISKNCIYSEKYVLSTTTDLSISRNKDLWNTYTFIRYYNIDTLLDFTQNKND